MNVRSDPDAVAPLEEERRFLLRSLDDLERERTAGDLDEDDYVVLKGEYTARAAAVLRALEDEKPGAAERVSAATTDGTTSPAAPAAPARRRSRTLLTVAAVALAAALAGGAVAASAGRRDPGQPASGEVRLTIRQQLADALRLGSQGEVLEAVKLYDDVLARDPDNVEALSYKGWMLVLATLADEGWGYLERAVAADPTYPDARVFRAIVLNGRSQPAEALAELEQFYAHDPPADMVGLADGLRADLEAQLAGEVPTSTTVPVAVR